MTLSESDKNTLSGLRQKQSKEALEHVRFLIDYDKLSLAVNRVYYSIFYIISAVAIKNDFSSSKHKQLLGWFNKNFIANSIVDAKYSKLIYEAFSNREKSDYDFFYELTENEVSDLFYRAKEFVEYIENNLLSSLSEH